MKILIIEDSQADRELMKTYLSQAEAKEEIIADESSNLEEAFENLNKNNYDAIFLDLRLPDTYGIETIQKTIDFLNNKSKTPIIIMTSVEDYNIGKKAITMGVSDFLIKGEAKSKEILRALSFAVYNTKKTKSKNKLFNKKKIAN